MYIIYVLACKVIKWDFTILPFSCASCYGDMYRSRWCRVVILSLLLLGLQGLTNLLSAGIGLGVGQSSVVGRSKSEMTDWYVVRSVDGPIEIYMWHERLDIKCNGSKHIVTVRPAQHVIRTLNVESTNKELISTQKTSHKQQQRSEPSVITLTWHVGKLLQGT